MCHCPPLRKASEGLRIVAMAHDYTFVTCGPSFISAALGETRVRFRASRMNRVALFGGRTTAELTAQASITRTANQMRRNKRRQRIKTTVPDQTHTSAEPEDSQIYTGLCVRSISISFSIGSVAVTVCSSLHTPLPIMHVSVTSCTSICEHL